MLPDDFNGYWFLDPYHYQGVLLAVAKHFKYPLDGVNTNDKEALLYTMIKE